MRSVVSLITVIMACATDRKYIVPVEWPNDEDESREHEAELDIPLYSKTFASWDGVTPRISRRNTPPLTAYLHVAAMTRMSAAIAHERESGFPSKNRQFVKHVILSREVSHTTMRASVYCICARR